MGNSVIAGKSEAKAKLLAAPTKNEFEATRNAFCYSMKTWNYFQWKIYSPEKHFLLLREKAKKKRNFWRPRQRTSLKSFTQTKAVNWFIGHNEISNELETFVLDWADSVHFYKLFRKFRVPIEIILFFITSAFIFYK